MYCPKCAEPNGEDVKYCRACGEDLTVIAQAMSRHLPVMLVSKLDDYVERKNERMRRDGILTGLSGVFLLISGIWQLSSNPGAWLPAAFMFLGALIMLIASMWDMLAYKRTRSRDVRNGRLPSAAKTGELKEHAPRQIPPAGVTEDTTRRLDIPVKDSTKSGDHL